MKIILKFFIILLFFGCTNFNNTKDLPFVNLIVQQDKYSLILKNYFHKQYNNYNSELAEITVETNLSFNSNNTLSKNGKKNLTIIKGTLNFKIIETLSNKIIRSGKISTSINTGNISSLYGIDQNNNFAKQRISKYLATRLYQKILLNISHSEN